ncbi:protein of unknown function [Kyrpidia spormannii]|uniref:Uncharacterized protein n=1 Tax=Kyrpidia spormannii TaxID=2055160 RepID=A0A6F9EF96_9BACL|nr:protein of unknown function [Kyrpidia spormannii]
METSTQWGWEYQAYQVRSVPMRNGNQENTKPARQPGSIVRSVPMRNGNDRERRDPVL